MNDVLIARTQAALTQAIAERSVGLVPTMGALHAGHGELIRRSARENPLTVVSIFVNPSQFTDASDYQNYPRAVDQDLRFARDHGAEIVFAPEPEIMYPPGFATSIQVGPLGDLWEGAARPGHFAGVATVVAKLLNIVRPARSYFGEKDFQQLQVVRRVHADLNLPGAIVGVATVRDPDGVALSSRNSRLSAEGRVLAGAIPEALAAMASASRTVGMTVGEVIEAGRRRIAQSPRIELDYLTIVDAATLVPVSSVGPASRAIVAAVVDGVRLIDNSPLGQTDGSPWV